MIWSEESYRFVFVCVHSWPIRLSGLPPPEEPQRHEEAHHQPAGDDRHLAAHLHQARAFDHVRPEHVDDRRERKRLDEGLHHGRERSAEKNTPETIHIGSMTSS